MTNREIRITASDMERLRELIEDAKRGDPRKAMELKDLEAELDRAILVPDDRMPSDVVQMHSEAHLVDEDTGEEIVCELVFPGEADITHMRVSVLAPVGTAMLGFRAGDRFEWQVPAGTRRLMVKSVG
jgi:regulator of nucleoside diphosphate kinase